MSARRRQAVHIATVGLALCALCFSSRALARATHPPPTGLVPGHLSVAPPARSSLPSPFTAEAEVDVSFVITGFALTLAPQLNGDYRPHGLAASPNPHGLNALDRAVLGHRSASAATLSDALLYGTMVAPFAAVLLEAGVSDHPQRWTGLARDSLVLMETALVNLALCNLVKSTVRRARPYTYDTTLTPEALGESESVLSFFSGHTAHAFAMANAFSYLYTLRHPDSPLNLPLWIGAHGLAATTGVARVLAGKHFWTDVLVGALVGSGIGLLVPYLHKVRDDGSSPFSDIPYLAQLRLTPSFHPGGFGMNAMIFW